MLLRSCQGIQHWAESIQAAVAESKRGAGTDQWLLSRRNIPGMEEEEEGRMIKDGLGTGDSEVNKPTYLTRTIKDQVSNSDDTFNMLRAESSRNLYRYKGINRLSRK